MAPKKKLSVKLKKRAKKKTTRQNLMVVSEIAGLPFIAVCKACGTRFKTNPENRGSLEHAKEHLQYEFDRHKCKPLDVSQNAVRIVSEATENK